MPVYVTFLTDVGMKMLEHKPKRIREVNREVMERFGVKVLAQYMLIGP